MQSQLTDLLRRQDWPAVVEQALHDRKTVRSLLKLLYHEDDYLHWLAADAIGRYGLALADIDAEKTREFVRRLLWNLNEECGASPWGSVEAIGAIAAVRTDLFAHYVSILFPFHEDESLAPGVIWTIVQVGRQLPTVAEEYEPFLIDSLLHPRAVIRGYAAWALGELKVLAGYENLEQLAGDDAVVHLYEMGGAYHEHSVADVARRSREVLQKMRS